MLLLGVQRFTLKSSLKLSSQCGEGLQCKEEERKMENRTEPKMTKMTMPGFTADATLREGLQRDWAGRERSHGKERGAVPQLFCRLAGFDRVCCWGDFYFGCHYLLQ